MPHRSPAVAQRGKSRRPRTRRTLGTREIIAFIGTTDPSRAKAFYRDALGLALRSEDEFALAFDAHGTMLRVTAVQQLVAAAYTVLGWRVPNIVTAVRELQAAGVRFERYQGMPQDERGIWKSPSGAQVAWFKDPDGNTLSITQF
jgi:catechol 2,3-dioxygenase-like lactoylglutathione lyase family enzyme